MKSNEPDDRSAFFLQNWWFYNLWASRDFVTSLTPSFTCFKREWSRRSYINIFKSRQKPSKLLSLRISYSSVHFKQIKRAKDFFSKWTRSSFMLEYNFLFFFFQLMKHFWKDIDFITFDTATIQKELIWFWAITMQNYYEMRMNNSKLSLDNPFIVV